MVPFQFAELQFAEFQYLNRKPNTKPNPNPLTSALIRCNVEFGELKFSEMASGELKKVSSHFA